MKTGCKQAKCTAISNADIKHSHRCPKSACQWTQVVALGMRATMLLIILFPETSTVWLETVMKQCTRTTSLPKLPTSLKIMTTNPFYSTIKWLFGISVI